MRRGDLTDLEPGRAPIDELNCPLCPDVCNGCVDVLWDDVTSVEQAARPDNGSTRPAK